MSTPTLTRRVDRLDEAMTELAHQVAETSAAVARTEANLDRLSKEWKVNFEEHQREMRRMSGEFSRQLGTLAEDLVAPSVPRILREVVGCTEEPLMEGVRVRRRLSGGRFKEYDVIAVCGDYLLINETRVRLRPEDVPEFVRVLRGARDFLPEYADKKIVGVLAIFYLDPSLVAYVERQGIIMLGIGDGLLTLLNSSDFKPTPY